MDHTSSPGPQDGEIGSAIKIKSLEHYVDFLSQIIVRAPNSFRNYDYPPAYQLNFEVAFRLAREGMTFVEERIDDSVILARLRGLIEESYQAFSSFDFEGRKKGSWIMQQFEAELLTALRRAPRKKKAPWG